MKVLHEILDRVIAVDASADMPLHTQLRRSLRTVIEKHFEDGERFFSEAELIAYLQISQGTVRRALADLASEGLLERRVAKGSFVRKTPAAAQTRSVGVFVPAFESDFWARVMGQISRRCREMRASMSIYHTERGEKLADAFRCLKNPPTQERIIILGVTEPGELLRALTDRGYRAVVLDTPASGEWNFVGVDNRKGIELGMAHLLELGHRDIALLVNEMVESPSIAARIEAYRACMEGHGLRPTVIDCGCNSWDDSVEAAYNTMGKVFAMTPRPSALFAVSDAGGWGALRWCAMNGVRVPTDLSILGFDDDRPSRFTQPPMSSVVQPVDAIAEAAMNVLWDDAIEVRHELLVPALAVRESTAAPNTSPSAAGIQHLGLKST